LFHACRRSRHNGDLEKVTALHRNLLSANWFRHTPNVNRPDLQPRTGRDARLRATTGDEAYMPEFYVPGQ
jgi:hypothetical protein